MTQDVGRPIRAQDLEIAVIRREPAVEHLGDLHCLLAKKEPAWRFLASMSGIAFDTKL